MSEGTATIPTNDGDWIIEWAGLIGVGYPSIIIGNWKDGPPSVDIAGDIMKTKGAVPRTVVEALFARVER